MTLNRSPGRCSRFRVHSVVAHMVRQPVLSQPGHTCSPHIYYFPCCTCLASPNAVTLSEPWPHGQQVPLPLKPLALCLGALFYLPLGLFYSSHEVSRNTSPMCRFPSHLGITLRSSGAHHRCKFIAVGHMETPYPTEGFPAAQHRATFASHWISHAYTGDDAACIGGQSRRNGLPLRLRIKSFKIIT